MLLVLLHIDYHRCEAIIRPVHISVYFPITAVPNKFLDTIHASSIFASIEYCHMRSDIVVFRYFSGFGLVDLHQYMDRLPMSPFLSIIRESFALLVNVLSSLP